MKALIALIIIAIFTKVESSSKKVHQEQTRESNILLKILQLKQIVNTELKLSIYT